MLISFGNMAQVRKLHSDMLNCHDQTIHLGIVDRAKAVASRALCIYTIRRMHKAAYCRTGGTNTT